MNVQAQIDPWVFPEGDPALSRASRVVRLVLRRKFAILVVSVVFMIIGGVLVLWRKPSYTATAQLIVENTRLETARQELLPANALVDSSMVETQLELIKSDALAQQVIGDLQLDADPSDPPGAFASIKAAIRAWLPITTARDPARARQGAALKRFTSNLTVKRIKLSSVIEVAYRSTDPETAALVTNALVAEVLKNQASANAAAAATASAWLRDKIKDLGPKIRVVSNAQPPADPDGPGALLLLAAVGVLGFLAAFGAALVSACRNDTVLDPGDVLSRFDMRYLGSFQAVRPLTRILRRRRLRRLTSDGDFLLQALFGPQLRDRCVLGLIGVLPGPGLLGVAKGLAAAAAGRGVSCAVLGPDACEAEAPTDAQLVIACLPPMALSPSISAPENALDKLVLVIDWGRVAPALLRESMLMAPLPVRRLSGFVLNGVPRSWISRRTFPLESVRWRWAGRRG